jgi:Cd2+/Zn2+-exporting ATPase
MYFTKEKNMFKNMTDSHKERLKFLILIGLFTLLASIADHTWNNSLVTKIVFLILYILAGKNVIRLAFLGIKNKQPLDEQFLMTLATVAAFVIGKYHEAVFVMLFYNFGELFEDIATNQSKENIKSLIEIVPEVSTRILDGKREKVDIDEIEVGDILEITDGEKVPVDGIIIEGSALLDTSSLTGESLPQEVDVDDEILSSSIVTDGIIRMKAEKEFDDSIASKIIELIEDGVENKSSSEKFITRFARIYTPVVVIAAVLLAVIPPLMGGDWRDYLLRAATFLVLSCPCALVLSVPLTFISGLGLASKNGLLIKGSEYIESLVRSDVLLTDKTGTLTTGNFKIKDIEYFTDYDKERLLDYIYNIEKTSTHPIARAIVEGLDRHEDKGLLKEVKNLKGLGVRAVSKDDEIILLGSKKLTGYEGPDDKAIFVAINDKLVCKISIEDEIKKETATTIDKLKSYFKDIAIVSGDNQKAVKETAEELNLDDYYYELMPDQKIEVLEKYQINGQSIVYVGDGINDAPVLKVANVGISMGDTASDIAIESSDILVVNGEFSELEKLMKIAKLSMKTVKENVTFIMGVKLIILIMGLFGYASMWLAIFGDVGVSIIAILWAMRILKKEV